MTHDEWKKARVEEAAKVLHKGFGLLGCNIEEFYPLTKTALKAADAVELPGEDELVELMCKAYWGTSVITRSYSGLDEDFKNEMRSGMRDVIAALRPWIATQIEKGK